MRARAALLLILFGLAALNLLYAQKPFRQYLGAEDRDYGLPLDYERPAEFTRARLKYRGYGALHGMQDVSGGQLSWTIDYPKTDRLFLKGIKRLTTVDAKSVEQIVELDNTDDIYNYPFLYAVEAGHWVLSNEEADQLREYLLKGGFIMTDDFHGTAEWEVFMDSMRKVFPDRPVVDIDGKDPIFHVLYDLDDRYQVPGAQWLYSGSRYEYDGFEAKWRAVYDDDGHIVAGICHNMDLGDAIEWSDDPRYPEKYSALAYRIAINYVIYSLTH